MKTDQYNISNEDNMLLMSRYEDSHFDLAIVDVPYGINIAKTGKVGGVKLAKVTDYGAKEWDSKSPNLDYFNELIRVSKNQIIWGANHFIENIPAANSSSWVVWDKQNGDNDFADCELAYTSFKGAVRMWQFRWAGMLQGDMKNKETRIHPTQKPVKLYEWLFKNYAKENDKILDTHGGSMSIALALHNMNLMEKMNLHLTMCELDSEYFNSGVSRIKTHTAQKTIFDTH
jgi:site-specific DNA-methyltransferase (adenine-specific)